MKCALLAGGKGTRLIEETLEKPKPMVEIGGKPILWHIMKRYSHYGIKEFVICLGYKGEIIKKYFENVANNEGWECSFIDTGEETMTGGRLKRVQKLLEDNTFCFTYGDTINDVDISKLIKFHENMKTMATVTACIPPEKYGILDLNGDMVRDFREKPKSENWVNGGYFVLEPGVFDFIKNDSTVWEEEPLKKLAREGKLAAYRHTGFYQPMDMLKDKILLEDIWNSGNAKWKVWS